MYGDCYLRQGVVYIPTHAKTVDGIYISGEPIAVVTVDNTRELEQAFRETFARGNTIIPRVDFRKERGPDVRHYAGVKTWTAFERGATIWSIGEKDGIYWICICRRRRDRGWEDDKERQVNFPAATSLEVACTHIVEIIQEKARE